MTVESSYVPDKAAEALGVFGSPDDECHPSISYLVKRGALLPFYRSGAGYSLFVALF